MAGGFSIDSSFEMCILHTWSTSDWCYWTAFCSVYAVSVSTFPHLSSFPWYVFLISISDDGLKYCSRSRISRDGGCAFALAVYSTEGGQFDSCTLFPTTHSLFNVLEF